MKLGQGSAAPSDPFSRQSNLLDRVSASSHASVLQGQVDQLASGFVQQATEWKSLAAMMAGGIAYRMGRVGILGIGSGTGLKALSLGAGLTAEVATFEFTHRSLESHSNLWRWNGSGGLRQGLLNSLLTFGTLKAAGRLAQGQNLILQHGAQDLAMVFGHQFVHRAGIGPAPEGSLAEQLLHAEATNLQLGAGVGLGHLMMGGRLQGIERGLELSLQSKTIDASISARPQNPRQAGLRLAMAPVGAAADRPQAATEIFNRRKVFIEGNHDEGAGPPKPKTQSQGTLRGRNFLLRVKPDQIQGFRVARNRFGGALQEIFAQKFNGDIVLMAERLGLSPADANVYLQGKLPRSYEMVERMALRLGVGPEGLTGPWLSDQMARLNATYPLPEGIGPAAQALTHLVRLTLLRQSKTGAIRNGADQKLHPVVLAAAFKGDLPVKPGVLQNLFRLIVDSGAAEESTVRSAVGAYVEERFPDGKYMGRPDREYQNDEFDHRHYDALEAGKVLSLDDLSSEQELLALHLSEASPYSMAVDSPAKALQKKRAVERLSSSLSSLFPFEVKILNHAFGLSEKEIQSLEQIGKIYSLSGERIRQMKEQALEKMQERIGDWNPDSMDSREAASSEGVKAVWHELAREPYLLKNSPLYRKERKAELMQILRERAPLVEDLRRGDRTFFERFQWEAWEDQHSALNILRRFAEQKDPRRALPYILTLIELVSMREEGAWESNSAGWHVRNLNTDFLKKAARNPDPSAYLALKWLADKGNRDAQDIWHSVFTGFLSLQKTPPSVPERTGIYLLNLKGEGHQLPEEGSLLILPHLPPHPFHPPQLLLFHRSKDGLRLIREDDFISEAKLREETLTEGYPISISGEKWVLRKDLGKGSGSGAL